MNADCPLCQAPSERILFETEDYRVIVADDDPNVPAFCRLIWRHHVREMTDLSPDERMKMMNAVFQLEAAMRHVLQPSKINLASLGNVVPHVHWHVIARFEDDAHFPAPVWAVARREASIRLPENWIGKVQDYLHQQLYRPRQFD